MLRLFSFVAVAAVLAQAGAQGGQTHAKKTMRVAAQSSAALPSSADRALVDRYCVSCHSDKLKTGGLSLEKVDIANVPANAQVLEKIVRKLRSGLMPPEGHARARTKPP